MFNRIWAGASALFAAAVVATLFWGPRGVDMPEGLADQPFEARWSAALAALEEQGAGVVAGYAREGASVVAATGDVVPEGVAAGDVQVDLNSITKTVTAVLVLDAVEAGLFALDTPLADLLPDVPEDKAGITVHQLLTHSAGFPEAIGDDDEVIGRSAYLARAFEAGLEGPPGQYLYSNVGYGVLAAIVETAGGESYADRLAAMLTEAGLPSMGYDGVLDTGRALSAPGGDTIRAASWGGGPPGWHLIGNGGLIATPAGFLAFEEAFRGGRIVGDDLVQRALSAHVAEDAEESSFYGYGLVVEEVPELGRVFWHDGGNGAFSAEWAYLEAHNTTLFVAAPGEEAFAAMELLKSFLFPPAAPV
ncbi:serine hydrolase domain-containing protein [Pontivivens ytuae]|uniref:Beta-lactamase family protein n=1 Tax=Pontivivens ytuae TaxID=2789856 RepID=A0A7S9QBU9_9RHOB|nr:serine hydrolase domain-containing protein [Pontivivens ytuae]QPH53538.1 beta-lactamase family protein [Pontivivens ytuae]